MPALQYEQRAVHVKATVDAGPPKAASRPRPRAPASRARKEAQAEAAVSDLRMIENIAREMARPPSLSVLERKGPMSLNTNQRRKELQRIDHENQKLLKRLENQKSSYAQRDQKRSYDESRRHAALARARPRALPPRANRSAPERMQALPVSPNSSTVQASQAGALQAAPSRLRDSTANSSEESTLKGRSSQPNTGAVCQNHEERSSQGAVVRPEECLEDAAESMCEELPQPELDQTPPHVDEELREEAPAEVVPGISVAKEVQEVEGYSDDEEFYDVSEDESDHSSDEPPFREEDTSPRWSSEVHGEEEFPDCKEAAQLAQSLASKALSISEGLVRPGDCDGDDCGSAATGASDVPFDNDASVCSDD